MKTAFVWAGIAMIASTLSLNAAPEIAELKATIARHEAEVVQLKQQLANLEKKQAAQDDAQVNQAPPAAKASPQAATYTVKAGDSWDKIARKNNTTSAKLAKANGMKLSKLLHPGDTLKLPSTPATHAAVKPQPAPARAEAPKQVAQSSGYVVKEGDTYLKIAKKLNVSAESLMAANPETKANQLRPGQTIRVTTVETPTSFRKPTPPAASTPLNIQEIATSMPVINRATSAPSPTQGPKPIISPAEPKVRAVTIQQDMTFMDFARTHKADVARLNALNGLDLKDNTLLAKGSELYVPVP